MGKAGTEGQVGKGERHVLGRGQDMGWWGSRQGHVEGRGAEGHTNLGVGSRHVCSRPDGEGDGAEEVVNPDDDEAVDTVWAWCRSEEQLLGARTDIFSRLSSGPCGCRIHLRGLDRA